MKFSEYLKGKFEGLSARITVFEAIQAYEDWDHQRKTNLKIKVKEMQFKSGKKK